MTTTIVFSDSQSFTQAAFERVAKIVSEHGFPCLEACVPAVPTHQCLSHLALVASEWGYDYSTIEAHADNYKKSNDEIVDYFGDDC